MKKRIAFICAAVILCCGIMAVVDGIIQPPYAIKSGIKVLLFLLIPVGFALFQKLSLSLIFRPDKHAVYTGLLLGIATFAVIIGGYALLRSYLDLSAIPASLEQSAGITADNFLFVGLYIAFFNSLLEEFFFRGFSFLVLRQIASKRYAMLFSAAAFAIYHAAILKGWFSPVLMLLTLSALFACGLFFNWLDQKKERIWVSWLVHLFANLAINTIGMKLLNMF